MSDYHHLKPAIWKKRISTCQFEKPRANGHGRSISRFTVISNAAETETDTYDPYRDSRMLQRCDSQVSQAKVIVHRDGQVVTTTATGQVTTRMRSGSNTRRMRANSTRASLTSRPQSSRGSLASLRSSRQGTPQIRVPSLRHKRGVDFSHARKRSNSAGPGSKIANRKTGSGVVAGNRTSQRASAPVVRSPSPEMARMADGTYPKARGGPPNRSSHQSGASMIFHDELRKFSNTCAEDCDAAFKSSIAVYDSECDSSMTDGDRRNRESNPFSISLDSPTTTISPVTEASSTSWHSRPLPPLPKDASMQSRQTTSYGVDDRPMSPDRDEDMEAYIEEASRVAVLLPRQVDRRIVSAPAHSHANRKLSTLPSINENAGLHGDGTRIVSAPPHSPMRKANEKNRSMEYLSKVENTIRVVNSSVPGSPLKSPTSLVSQKKNGDEYVGHPLHRQLAHNAEEYDDHIYDAEQGPRKKISSWFRRNSRAESTMTSAGGGGEARRASSSTDSKQHRSDEEANEHNKKRNFTFPFWKSNKVKDSGMTIEGNDGVKLFLSQRMAANKCIGLEDVPEKQQVISHNVTRKRRSGMTQSNSSSTRNIEVKQNWLTRLFRVKPATSYLCMTLSSKRARQEVVILLREWRRYGMRGIQVDKQRNIVFGRLGAKNCMCNSATNRRRSSADANEKQ